MKVLVAYGSKRRSTAEIAGRIGDTLRGLGLETRVVAANEVRNAEAYDAVIVGGALYAFRWHRHARRFVRRSAEVLRQRDTWFFSSGPLDDSAKSEIAPVAGVQKLMALVGAQGHITFGGRLAPDAKGFIASKMAQTRAGDWRDLGQIDAWAREVGQRLAAKPVRARLQSVPAAPPEHPVSSVAVALSLVVGLTALVGGAALALRPDGAWLKLPLWLLQYSPFDDFRVPGLLLFFVVGLGNTAAGVLHLRRDPNAPLASFFGGSALVVWLVVQMVLLRSAHWLQVTCLILGLATVLESMRRAGGPRSLTHGPRPAPTRP